MEPIHVAILELDTKACQENHGVRLTMLLRDLISPRAITVPADEQLLQGNGETNTMPQAEEVHEWLRLEGIVGESKPFLQVVGHALRLACGPQLLHLRAISGSTYLKAQGTHAKTLDVEVPMSDNKRGWTTFGCASFMAWTPTSVSSTCACYCMADS